ncbi:MAG: hypothetical protein C4325_07540 [Blastocatellia bacterium]
MAKRRAKNHAAKGHKPDSASKQLTRTQFELYPIDLQLGRAVFPSRPRIFLWKQSFVTEERLYDALFGTNAFLEALLAERSAQAIGYALFFPVFASFSGERRLFLEDLYVAADARGSGVGRQLLREIARRGLEKGLTGIEFHVPQSNSTKI